MKIAILGAGSVGGALGRLWAARGHTICFGVPNPDSDRTRALIESLGNRAKATTNAIATATADIVVLAVRWGAAESALAASVDLKSKIIIDATNPLAPDLSGLVIGNTWSAGEQVEAWTGGKVVKAFNTIGSVLFGVTDFVGMRADGFYCGNDLAAKALVRNLIAEIGMDPVDVGPLRNARLLEPMALLWIDLANNRGWGRNHGFKLLRRS